MQHTNETAKERVWGTVWAERGWGEGGKRETNIIGF